MFQNNLIPEESLEIQVDGIHCAGCVSRIEKALQDQIPNIEQIAIDITSGRALVQGQNLPLPEILSTLKKLGYEAALWTTGGPLNDKKNLFEPVKTEHQSLQSHRATIELVWMFVLSGLLMVIHMSPVSIPNHVWVEWLLATPVVLWGGRSFFKNTFKQLPQGIFTMDTLVALGAGVAYGYSTFYLLTPLSPSQPHIVTSMVYFETAAMIVTLVRLGRYLEEKAKKEASHAVEHLMRRRPTMVTIQEYGAYKEISLDSLQAGQQVLVRAGDLIPADGQLVYGVASVDESMITGESIPVDKKPGDKLYEGTLNIPLTTGAIVMRVEQTGTQTMLGKMITLVEQASLEKPPIQRFADTVAGIFVPIVVALSFLTGLGWVLSGASLATAIQPAIAVLVTACPCAMGLATPIAIKVASGKAASMGLFIKNVSVFEKMQHIDRIVFDKTGTLTLGKPTITDILYPEQSTLTETEILQSLASVEHYSEHPFAKALVTYAFQDGIELLPIEDFELHPGEGVRGQCLQHRIHIGQEAYLQKALGPENTKLLEALRKKATHLAEQGKSVLFYLIEPNLLGLIALQDQLRPEASETLQSLQVLGIKPSILTGDRSVSAQAIAKTLSPKTLSLEDVHAELSPADKVQIIESLQKQGHRVVMVGDGLNDGPALAKADISFAMGQGTDLALSTADITLITNELSKIEPALRLGKKTLAIIRQNLFWAFFYNILTIPLAALGVLHPIAATSAMALSSLSVIANSLRLKN